VKASLSPLVCSEELRDKLMDDFLEFLEGHNLYCGGSISLDSSPNGTFDFIVELGRDDGRLELRKQMLTDWLRSDPRLEGLSIGALVDLWYPPKNFLLE